MKRSCDAAPRPKPSSGARRVPDLLEFADGALRGRFCLRARDLIVAAATVRPLVCSGQDGAVVDPQPENPARDLPLDTGPPGRSAWCEIVPACARLAECDLLDRALANVIVGSAS